MKFVQGTIVKYTILPKKKKKKDTNYSWQIDGSKIDSLLKDKNRRPWLFQEYE